MTEICGWRAFATARTAKHFGIFVRIVTQAKEKVWQLLDRFEYKNPTTHSSFLQCAHTSDVLICCNILSISFIFSNYFKCAVALFNLLQLYFTYSNFILFAACPLWATVVIGNRWPQNMVRQESGTPGDSRVCHSRSYHILTSSVMYYLIYLFF